MPRIANERLSKTVADDLQQQIIEKRLQVGDQLPTEPELMEEYGVSRTVIREATAYLVSRGVVDIRPRRGMTVRAPDGKGLAETLIHQLQMSKVSLPQLLQVRMVLETSIVRLAALERSEEDVALLRDSLNRLKTADISRQDAIEADIAFHELLASATHNPFFVLVSRPITELLHSLYLDKSGYLSYRSQTCAEHEAIVDAIEKGTDKDAVAAMEKHLDRVGATIEKLISQRDRHIH